MIKKRLGFPKRLVWPTIAGSIFVTFSSYYPTFDFPPIKQAKVFAQVQEQRAEIVPASFSKPLSLPHPGFLSTQFSTWHPGIDIASGLGMPIHPIIDGVVEEVGRDFFGLGSFVTVSHESNFKSKYAHMGTVYVKAGDEVSQDNTLGEVGMTGRTTGAHTHLEITLNGQFIDPTKLLPEIPRI